VLYGSRNDVMLGISSLVNGGPRTGRLVTGAPAAVPGFETVDVTDGARADGAFRKVVEPKHAMRWASSAIYDFFSVVRGVPSECRSNSAYARQESTDVWSLVGGPIPLHPPAPTGATVPSC
jgi:hypothetical protein